MPTASLLATGGRARLQLTLTWLAGSSATVLATEISTVAAGATLAAAACLCLLLLRLPLGTRLLTVSAMTPALLGDAPLVWPWLGAGAALILANAWPSAPAVTASGLSDVQRALARCRRREEGAHLLLLRLPAGAIDATELAGSFRVTDAIAVVPEGGEIELGVLVEDGHQIREGLERRLLEHFGSLPPVGWAKFPDDGVTFDVLHEQARQRRARSPLADAVATAPGRRAAGSPKRWRSASL